MMRSYYQNNTLEREYSLKLKDNKLNYFLTYIFVCIPGTLFFHGREMVYIIAFIYSFLLFLYKKKHFDNEFLLFFSFLFLLEIIQSIIFEKFDLVSFLGFIQLFFFPYFLIKNIGNKIFHLFINVVCAIAIVSFVFYFPSLISHGFHKFIGQIPRYLHSDYLLDNQNFIIFTWEEYNQYGFLRNSGNYTEPGSFQEFLNVALMLNIVLSGKLINKKNIIFIVAIITTQSTGAYVTLFCIIVTYIIIKSKFIITAISVPLILLLSLTVYEKAPFLKEKIESQYNTQSKKSPRKYKGRFMSAFLDLKDFQKNPIFGRGLIKQTRFENYRENDVEFLRYNGTTDFLVKVGGIGFIIYFYLMYKSLRRLCLLNNFNMFFAFAIIVFLLINGFGQSIFFTHICIGLTIFTLVFSYSSNLEFYKKLNGNINKNIKDENEINLKK